MAERDFCVERGSLYTRHAIMKLNKVSWFHLQCLVLAIMVESLFIRYLRAGLCHLQSSFTPPLDIQARRMGTNGTRMYLGSFLTGTPTRRKDS